MTAPSSSVVVTAAILLILLVAWEEQVGPHPVCHAFSVLHSTWHSTTGAASTTTTTRLLSSSPTSSSPSPSPSSSSGNSSSTPRRKPLSPQEILKQQRQKQGLDPEEDDDEYPKLFDDDILDHMRQILLTLEERVQKGPGSLSHPQIEELVDLTNKVEVEMKEKEYQRLNDASTASAVTPPPPPAASSAPPAVAEAATATAVATDAVEVTTSKAAVMDTSNDEGPAYDGTGGMGMPKGTRSTYVIEGMDEMSPLEYQKALQDSISQRQDDRKKAGHYGNRQTWDYLNNLTGESGQLKTRLGEKEEEEDDDDNVERP